MVNFKLKLLRIRSFFCLDKIFLKFALCAFLRQCRSALFVTSALGTEMCDFYSLLHWQQQWRISPFMESNQVCLTRFHLDSELFVSFVSCSKTGSLIPAGFKAFYWAPLNFDLYFENCYMYHCQVPKGELTPYGEAPPGFRYMSMNEFRDFTSWSIWKGWETVISVCKKENTFWFCGIYSYFTDSSFTTV